MVVIYRDPENISSSSDPIVPWLRSIEKALDDFKSGKNDGSDLDELVSQCVRTFKNDIRYRDDVRFLKIDGSPEYESIFTDMQHHKICLSNSLLYEAYAIFLEAKGKLIDADLVYQLGISRNAEPVGRLKKAHTLFLERIIETVKNCSLQKMDDSVLLENGESCVNPWSIAIVKDLLWKMNVEILKYEGYHSSEHIQAKWYYLLCKNQLGIKLLT